MMKNCILWILNRYYKKFCMSKENRYFLRVLHWISIFLKNRCSKMAVSPDRFYLRICRTISPWHLLERVLVFENHCNFLNIYELVKKSTQKVKTFNSMFLRWQTFRRHGNRVYLLSWMNFVIGGALFMIAPMLVPPWSPKIGICLRNFEKVHQMFLLNPELKAEEVPGIREISKTRCFTI